MTRKLSLCCELFPTSVYIGNIKVTYGPNMTFENQQVVDRFIESIKMLRKKCSDTWSSKILKLAITTEGVSELFYFLADPDFKDVQDEIVCDLIELVDDNRQVGVTYTPVTCPDISTLIEANRVQKEKLAKLVDEHGGVTEVAKLSGLPEAYIQHRMLSGGRPLRKGMVKILTESMGLSSSDFVASWMSGPDV